MVTVIPQIAGELFDFTVFINLCLPVEVKWITVEKLMWLKGKSVW